MKDELIYLASPYAHEDLEVMQVRYNQVAMVTAQMLLNGIHVYSPIVHCHYLSQCIKLPRTWEFWKEHDFAMISRCDRLQVLKLEGWEISVGVTAEIKFAKEKNILGKFFTYREVMDELIGLRLKEREGDK